MDVQDIEIPCGEVAYESTSQDARDDSDLGDEGEEEVSSTL
jgi:hypothetical protein